MAYKVIHIKNFPFTCFSDGQPHLVLASAAYGKVDTIEIVTDCSPTSILKCGLLVDTLVSMGKAVNVTIEYLLGARMDRRTVENTPFTLKVVAGMINGALKEANQIRLVSPHSEVATKLIDRSVAIGDRFFLDTTLSWLQKDVVIAVPDAGALTRYKHLLQNRSVVECSKVRNPATGELSGFTIVSGDPAGKNIVIIDDICDGGGTFTGIASVLRASGANSVSLAVTHGIFSKGFDLPGIDAVFTTDTYQSAWKYPDAETGPVAPPYVVIADFTTRLVHSLYQ